MGLCKGGTTYGNVFITGDSPEYLAKHPGIVKHEKRHAPQWAATGPVLFPIAYGAAELIGGGPCGNVFERDAGLEEGGYKCK